MKIHCRKIVIGITAFLAFSALNLIPSTNSCRAQAWNIYLRADITNRSGDIIHLENINQNGLFFRFFAHNLKEKIASRPPRYRVDQGAIHDLAKAEYLTYGETRWFRYRLMQKWDYDNPLLQELLQGKELIIQYYPAPNLIKEAVFRLDGIHKAIREIWPATTPYTE